VSPSKLKPATIKSSGNRDVTVERTGNIVKVTWVCGAERFFTPEGLRQAIDNFELATSYNGDVPVWLEDRDHHGTGFACKLAGGRFHADDSVDGTTYDVPWSSFKKALIARSK
jgi:hypothetical protein